MNIEPYTNIIMPIIFLVLLSIIDIKTFNNKDEKIGIPSAISTLFLIISFIIGGFNSQNTIIGLLIALLLVDMDFFLGIPDIKIFVACCMLLPTYTYPLVMGVTTLCFGIILQLASKKMKLKLTPMIPSISISYFTIVIIGGLL